MGKPDRPPLPDYRLFLVTESLPPNLQCLLVWSKVRPYWVKKTTTVELLIRSSFQYCSQNNLAAIRVNPNQVKIKQRMHIGSKQDAVCCVVRSGPQYGFR